jgi:hypothetical protein
MSSFGRFCSIGTAILASVSAVFGNDKTKACGTRPSHCPGLLMCDIYDIVHRAFFMQIIEKLSKLFHLLFADRINTFSLFTFFM